MARFSIVHDPRSSGSPTVQSGALAQPLDDAIASGTQVAPNVTGTGNLLDYFIQVPEIMRGYRAYPALDEDGASRRS
jgi:hypothetical protein